MNQNVRLVRSLGSNRSFCAADGSLLSVDAVLTSFAGDPALGIQSEVVNTACSCNLPGATTATLLGIDTTQGTLVRIGGVDGTPSASGGALTTIGSLGLGMPLGQRLIGGGFHIASEDGAADAQLRVSDKMGVVSSLSGLYTIGLSTGAATVLGGIATSARVLDGLTFLLAWLPVPEPATTALWTLGVLCLAGPYRRRAPTGCTHTAR